MKAQLQKATSHGAASSGRLTVMRIPLRALIAIAVALVWLIWAGPGTAAAQSTAIAKNKTTVFDVSYMQVANDCGKAAAGGKLSKGQITITSTSESTIKVAVADIAVLKGTRAAQKFKARGRKKLASGQTVRYTASGRIAKGRIQMVFVAEFYRGKRPQCTQSWSAQGTKKR